MVNVPLVLTANPSVPVKDLKELAALLKGDPNLKYTYGSTGPGSFMNVIGEAFKKEAGVEMTHIPFKGAAPLKQELLAGPDRISAATSCRRRWPRSSRAS